MSEPLVEFRSVTKRFGDKVILDNIDLAIYPGDALGIIGPSGTGKSTILRIIAGLTKPDGGDVYIHGQKRLGLIEDGHDPIRMSMVFQQAALFDSLTVEENVGFYLLQTSKLSRQEIHRLVEEKLALVGLEGMGHLYPAELSGGMRKRVSFARAILDNPHDSNDDARILLYDEPTAGLDPIASTVIEDLICRLRANACSTYVIVTHQDTTIRRTSDRLILLYEGTIRWQGGIDELDSSPDPYLRQFVSGQVQGPIRVVEQIMSPVSPSQNHVNQLP